MSSLTATLPALTISSRRRRAQGKAEVQCGGKIQYIESRLAAPNLQSLPFQRSIPILHATGMRSRSVICAGAAEGQTQTVTRESSTITVAPVQGKEKSPDLDDGGSGLPPRDDGDGGGGGGGGGGWSGGFFFFGFLALLGLLKDQEEESPYKDKRRRYAN